MHIVQVSMCKVREKSGNSALFSTYRDLRIDLHKLSVSLGH
jgi:hypothetical protein